MSWTYLIDAFGWAATFASLLAFNSKVMVTLRAAAVFSCACMLIYSGFHHNWPSVATNGILLPVNVLRLREMRRLTREARDHPDGFAFLQPFAHKADFPAGTILFRKGEEAKELYMLHEGTVEIQEYGAKIDGDALFGEMAMFTADRKRTATAVCVTPVKLWRLGYGDLEQLCMQNPGFSLHMARIIVRRYEENVRQLTAAKSSPDAEKVSA